MYYVFNKDNNCIGKCSFTPDKQDLAFRGEYCIESSINYDISKLIYEEGLKLIDNTPSVDKSKIEHQWVKSEINKAQISLMYFWTKDIKRQTHTEQVWLDYIIALRNYTTTSEEGYIEVTSEVRPAVEDFIPRSDDQSYDLVEVEDGKVIGTDIIPYEELNPPIEEV